MSVAVIAAALVVGAVLGVRRAARLNPRPSSSPPSIGGWVSPAARWAPRHGPAADRRRRQASAAVPTTLDAVAEALRAGSSVRDAFSAAGTATSSLGSELAELVIELDAGTPAAAAIDHWAARSAVPGADLVAAAVDVSLRGGGSTACAIDGVAATLRERERVAAEVRAYATQARLSAAVLAAAPPAFAVLLAGSDHSVAAFLAGSRVGWVCLAMGLALDVTGWLWMRRICGAVQ